MGASFELRTTIKSKRTLEGLPEKILVKLRAAMSHVGKTFLAKLKTERLSGRPGLMRRTGELSRSFDLELTGERLSDLTLKVFSRAKQARLQEHGGTVRPKNAQWLAIPLEAAKTAAGVARGGPRDFKNTFFAWSRAGNLILFQRLGLNKRGKQRRRSFIRGGVREKSSIVPLFVMKKEVFVPPRLGMRDLWERTRLERNIILRSALKDLKKA